MNAEEGMKPWPGRERDDRDDLIASLAMQIAQAKAMMAKQLSEIERLTLENWQLKGALGYEVPGDIPEGDFKCGLCDARRRAHEGHWPPLEG